MAEWQQIGTVEVCVGTDGVTGVCLAGGVYVVRDRQFYGGAITKTEFECVHCQPRHRLIESCDGSVCVTGVTDLEPVPFEVEADAPDNAAIAREALAEWRECKQAPKAADWAYKWAHRLCVMLGAE